MHRSLPACLASLGIRAALRLAAAADGRGCKCVGAILCRKTLRIAVRRCECIALCPGTSWLGWVAGLATVLLEKVLGFDPFGGPFGGGHSIPWEMHAPAHSPDGLKRAGQTDQVNQASSSQTISDTQPLTKPQPAPPSACSQYDSECTQSAGSDKYSCSAGNCCRAFGNSGPANCVRGCLLEFEKRCFQSPNSGACRTEAHIFCYMTCGALTHLADFSAAFSPSCSSLY